MIAKACSDSTRPRLLRRLLHTGALLLAALGLLLGTPLTTRAQGSAGAGSLVQVEADDSISIDVKGVPLSELLQQLAEQAQLDLALSAPEAVLQTPITLRVTNRSRKEVLKRLSELSGLRIDARDRFLAARTADADADDRGRDRKRRKSGKSGKGDRNDRFQINQPLMISAGETVGDAVTVGAPLQVDGHVRGDAVAILGPITLSPTAVVDGDAVSIGGAVDVQPGAQLNGSRVLVPNPVPNMTRWLTHAQHDREGVHQLAGWWHAMFTAFRALGLLLLGLLLLSLAPQRLGSVATTLGARPGMSVLLGISLLIGLLPACLLLAVTLIGIPLIPLAIGAFLILLWVGASACAVRIGNGLPGSTRRGAFVNFALGVLLLTLIDLIPWVGTSILLGLSFAGAGACLLSRFGTRSPAPPSVPPAPPAATDLDTAVPD